MIKEALIKEIVAGRADKLDLRAADLSYADLVCVDLSGANLLSATLSGAILEDANLIDANLAGADLSKVDLSTANLTGADLTGANLSGAKVTLGESKNEEEVKMSEPVVKNAHYKNDFRGVTFDVYRAIRIFDITEPERQHMFKKLVRGSRKGHTTTELLDELQCCLDRWREIVQEDLEYEEISKMTVCKKDGCETYCSEEYCLVHPEVTGKESKR